MLENLVMTHSTEIGLVLFVLCFVAILAWATTRTRSELDDWSNLPLGDAMGSTPKEPTTTESRP